MKVSCPSKTRFKIRSKTNAKVIMKLLWRRRGWSLLLKPLLVVLFLFFLHHHPTDLLVRRNNGRVVSFILRHMMRSWGF
jgi:hypothetical protein